MEDFSQKLESLIRGPIWTTLNEIGDGKTRSKVQSIIEQLITVAEDEHHARTNSDGDSNSKKLVEELIEARDQAQAASKLKSEFVANMSHEIRTPLNGMLGMLEILLRTELTPSAREYALLVKEAGKSLLSILTDILDFSKIESGRLEITNCDFELTGLIEGVGEILAPQADSKELLLSTFIDPRIPAMLIGDPLRLRQVLLNLGGNGIKFTDKGSVAIEATLQESNEDAFEVKFSIIDTGMGIANASLENLFEPFVQIDGSIGRRHGGTGLGLSISKRLIELLGGTIEVASEINNGSTFSFTISFAAANQSVSTEDRLSISTPPGQNSTVIIVDGDQKLREYLVSYCQFLGRRAFACSTHAEADQLIAQARKEGFVSVIVDGARNSSLALEIYERQFFGYNNEKQKLYLVTSRDKKKETEDLLPKGAATSIIRPIRRNVLKYYLNFGGNQKTGNEQKDVKSGQELKDWKEAKEVIDGKDGRSKEGGQAVRSYAPPADRHTKLKALVADDNKLNQQVAKLLLEDLNIEVEVVENGVDAVEAFTKDLFDVVFLDCHMPELDGYAAARIIKKLQELRQTQIPVIAMTANVLQGNREACLAAGMDEFMPKPIEADELERVIRLWTEPKPTTVAPMQAVPDTVAQDHITTRAYATAASDFQIEPELTAPSGVKVINHHILMERFNDSNRKKILEMFCESLPSEFNDIESSLEQQNFAALKASAHSLKGACATVCAWQLTETLESLEEASKRNDAAICGNLLGRLRGEIAMVMAEIPTYL